MENIDQILEKIEELLDKGVTVPFSNKAVVDVNKVYELITDIRLKLPNEIKQSKWVIEERNKILVEAQKEADVRLKEAESEKGKLINEHEITKKAYEQSEIIIENAKKVSREMRLGAKEYADEILYELENNIKDMLNDTNQSYKQLEKQMVNQIRVLRGNRQELNVSREKKPKKESK